MIERAGAGALIVLMLLAVPAWAEAPILIGEINSYAAHPAFGEAYRKGWQLALDEVNRNGGVLGRPLEFVTGDDGADPAEAAKIAERMVARHVTLLAGTYRSEAALAVAAVAGMRKVPFLAGEPMSDRIVWARGNRYTFRLNPSAFMVTDALVREATRLPARRWALIAPTSGRGSSMGQGFRQLLQAARPDVGFITDQTPRPGHIDAAGIADAVAAAKPDAIFTALSGDDLVQFTRVGQQRSLFAGRLVIAPHAGDKDYLDRMRGEAPVGWIVTGYPQADLQTPEHRQFREAYEARWHEQPTAGSVLGYSLVKTIAAALAKAGSTDAEALVDSLAGLTVATPFGPATYRPIDHQSTLGTFIGTLKIDHGMPVFADWHYADGAEFHPPDDVVRQLRPGAAGR